MAITELDLDPQAVDFRGAAEPVDLSHPAIFLFQVPFSPDNQLIFLRVHPDHIIGFFPRQSQAPALADGVGVQPLMLPHLAALKINHLPPAAQSFSHFPEHKFPVASRREKTDVLAFFLMENREPYFPG